MYNNEIPANDENNGTENGHDINEENGKIKS